MIKQYTKHPFFVNYGVRGSCQDRNDNKFFEKLELSRPYYEGKKNDMKCDVGITTLNKSTVSNLIETNQ